MLYLLLWTGCDRGDIKTGDVTDIVIVDEDGDGIAADSDCDDSNASVNPEAEEVCDGLDNNCD
ncbi:MAG: putative metal-binding motif-containing protein, partial [Myxococcota bacterium]|nr:putative metal-binding motif-containing protein [Myxococcota bacterium]